MEAFLVADQSDLFGLPSESNCRSLVLVCINEKALLGSNG